MAEGNPYNPKIPQSTSLVDQCVKEIFPSPARQNRGYMNFILRCKCGYSPTVRKTKSFPAGLTYYTCGSLDWNQCDMYVFRYQFEHHMYHLCNCRQPMKIWKDAKTGKKTLCCIFYGSPESCGLSYDENDWHILR